MEFSSEGGYPARVAPVADRDSLRSASSAKRHALDFLGLGDSAVACVSRYLGV